MVHSNILWHIFEYVSNMSQFSRNKNDHFKPRLLQFQETVNTGSKFFILVQQCTFKKCFLNNFDSCLECESFSFTMLYTPCFEEVYLNKQNQPGCFCETSSLKAGRYCTMSGRTQLC